MVEIFAGRNFREYEGRSRKLIPRNHNQGAIRENLYNEISPLSFAKICTVYVVSKWDIRKLFGRRDIIISLLKRFLMWFKYIWSIQNLNKVYNFYKYLSFAKIFTAKIFFSCHSRKFVPAKINFRFLHSRKFVPAKICTRENFYQ